MKASRLLLLSRTVLGFATLGRVAFATSGPCEGPIATIISLQAAIESASDDWAQIDQSVAERVIAESSTPLDPWRHAWAHRARNGAVEVFSAGENGKPGDGDDIAIIDGRPTCPYDDGRVTEDGHRWVPFKTAPATAIFGIQSAFALPIFVLLLLAVGFALWSEAQGTRPRGPDPGDPTQDKPRK